MSTGKRIQEARKRAGLSQRQLGEKLGLSASMIGQWENGLRNPKYDTLRRIAAALDVDWMELVPDGTQGDIIADHLTEKIKKLPEQSIGEDISELAFYAGEAGGRYKGLIAALEPEVFDINRLLVQLNSDGRQKAVERVEELTEIPRYQAKKEQK